MAGLWIIVSILFFGTVFSQDKVPLVPCAAVNDTSCIYKSDLVEGKIVDQGAFSMYFVDLSLYTFSSSDPFSVTVQALEKIDFSQPNTSATISIYLKKDVFPTLEDFDYKFQVSCETENCLDLGNVPVCMSENTQSMNIMVVSDSGPLYYGLKLSILNSTSSIDVFDCHRGDKDGGIEFVFVFILLIMIFSLLCGCVVYTLCKLCGRTSARCERKCRSSATSEIGLSSINTEQAPFIPSTNFPPYPPMGVQSQPAPFYVLPPGFQPNQQQYMYAYYPVPAPQE